MAKYAAMVQETTNSTGSGNITLAGATPGHRTLANAFSQWDWVSYLLQSEDGALWERGYGQLQNPAQDTVERRYPKESSSGGAAIDLPAGTHRITIAPNPDTGQRRGYLLGYARTQTLTNEIQLKLVWDTLAANVRWDSDNLFGAISSASDFPIPEWVDKVRIACRITFAENAAGIRRMRCARTDGTMWYGLPEIYSPGMSSNVGSRLPSLEFCSGLIDRRESLDGTEFSIFGYQDSGGDLDIIGTGTFDGYLGVEFVE